jgi:hypothetical protein
MLFAAVTRLVEALSIEPLLTLKVEKPPNWLSGHTETNDIHNITTVSFPVEIMNVK